MNAADHGSRGRKLAMPAPRREWVHELFTGNVDALDRRLHEAAVNDTKAFDSTLGYPGEGPEDPAPRAAGRNARARDG